MNTQTICLDALQFSLKGYVYKGEDWGDMKINDNIFIKNMFRSVNGFQNMAQIIVYGEPFAEIQFNPRGEGNIMDEDLIIFKFKNNVLYSGGFMDEFKTICREMSWQFSHIGKIDIAVDTKENGYLKKLQGIITGKYHSVGKAQPKTIHWNKGKKFMDKPFNYLRIGESKSGKFVRCYYKREELKKSQKEYIEDFWRLNGIHLEPGEEMERVELSMKKKELYRYWQPNSFNDLKELQNPEFLAQLFESGRKGFFEFVKMSEYLKKGRVDRCKKVLKLQLINFSGKLLTKAAAAMANEVARFKQAAKTLSFIAKQTGKQLYHQIAEEMATNVNMFRWFYNKQEEWEYQFDLFTRKKKFQYVQYYNQSYHTTGVQMSVGVDNIKQLLNL